MKRFVYTIALVATMFFASSCEVFQKDGDWDPIELDKTHVNFPPEGGQNTVSALNYSDGGNPREAIIEMQAGDTFTQISIAQQ